MARRRPAIPHPSITGMAAGLSVAQYLNQGGAPTPGKGVIADVMEGDLSDAFSQLSDHAVNLATSTKGKDSPILSNSISYCRRTSKEIFPQCKTRWNKTILQNIRR